MKKFLIGISLALFIAPLVTLADAPYFTFSNPTFTGAGLTGNAANPWIAIYFFDNSGNNISGNAAGSGRAFQATGGNFTKTLTDFGEGSLAPGNYRVVVLTDSNHPPSGEDSACGTGQNLTGCQNNWGYSPDSNAAASVAITITPPGGCTFTAPGVVGGVVATTTCALIANVKSILPPLNLTTITVGFLIGGVALLIGFAKPIMGLF